MFPWLPCRPGGDNRDVTPELPGPVTVTVTRDLARIPALPGRNGINSVEVLLAHGHRDGLGPGSLVSWPGHGPIPSRRPRLSDTRTMTAIVTPTFGSFESRVTLAAASLVDHRVRVKTQSGSS